MTRTWILTLAAAALAPLAAAQQKPAAPVAPAPAPAPAAAATEPVADRITQEELKKLMKADKVLVVDVRGADAYKEAHIPGSISAPLIELDKHLDELKASKKPIVTYCS